MATLMCRRSGRHPKTGCKALFTYKPGTPSIPENRYYVWHKTPQRLSIASRTARHVQDKQVFIDTKWAKGQYQHKRMETREKANHQCQSFGKTDTDLFVHHPHRLSKIKTV
jgi:hypothetical protein